MPRTDARGQPEEELQIGAGTYGCAAHGVKSARPPCPACPGFPPSASLL